MRTDKKIPDYFKYWGKTRKIQEKGFSDDVVDYHLLAYHSLDVAAMGHVLLKNHSAYINHFLKLTGLDRKEFEKWFVFLLALHDLGKFSESFQNLSPSTLKTLQQCESNRNYILRHDSLGWFIWQNHIKKEFQELEIIPQATGSKRRAALPQPIDYWIGAIIGHHGKPPRPTARHLERDYLDPDKDLKAISAYVRDLIPLLLQDSIFPKCDMEKMQFASWWLSGLAVLCDWLGSNTEFFPYFCNTEKPVSLTEYWKIAKQSAQTAIRQTGVISNPISVSFDLGALLSSNSDTKATPTPLQKLMINLQIADSSHLFILEDVTGSGKTEAAMLLSHRLMSVGQGDSLYFALPTMATANSMYMRMGTAYRKLFAENARPSLVLAHGASRMSKEFQQSIFPGQTETDESYGDDTATAGTHCNAWLADNRKKALLADIGIGTIDQALLAILPVHHQSLRMLGLVNKILIVDEVHACDAYMHELLCTLLHAHAKAGGSTILLSATLPHKQRQSLINAYASGKNQNQPTLTATGNKDYPLVSCLNSQGLSEQVIATKDSVCRTVEVKFVNHLESITRILEEAVARGQCVCWIRNTVKDAIETWQALNRQHPNWTVDLFHARYALADRIDIENRVRDRFGSNSTEDSRRAQILIATQVVEQSLDLDFDVLITDLAPVDLIIQRAGRLCRHTRDVRGNRLKDEDQRGIPVLFVHSPPISDNPKGNWYTHHFPSAAKIYPHHGQLWLTAKLLNKHGKFRMPEDARNLIEGVYSDEVQQQIPTELLQQSIESEGSNRAEASYAQNNALKIASGYTDDSSSFWFDESMTPTRLGEDTKLVYLAKWENDLLAPWSDDEHHAWQNSAVSMRTHWIAGEASNNGIPHTKIEQCKAQLPAKGKWGVLLPLTQTSNGEWQGIAINGNNQITRFIYSPGFGLMADPELYRQTTIR